MCLPIPHVTRRPGQILLAGEPMVLHCNHYNRFLQMVVEGCQSIDGVTLQLGAAVEVIYRQLNALFHAYTGSTSTERGAYAARQYAYCGFGHLYLEPLPDVGPAEWIVREDSSHYANALLLNWGTRTYPGELFDLGYCVATFAAAYHHPYRGEILFPESALSAGGNQTLFRIFQDEGAREHLRQIQNLSVDAAIPAQIPSRSCGLHVDEEAIMAALSGMLIQGDPESGLIEAFGVQLTLHYADYYNLLSFRFERLLQKALAASPFLARTLAAEYPVLSGYKDFSHLRGDFLAHTLLTEAGHICGFRTMGGIMSSPLWEGLVLPMLRDKADWIHGIVAAINTLGWGIWRVMEIIPDKKLVLRAWQPYESLGHLRAFGLADAPVDHLFAGVATALMNLLYNVDITQKPVLSEAFYEEAMHAGDHFWARQTACVAQGNPYSEVVVERGILRSW